MSASAILRFFGFGRITDRVSDLWVEPTPERQLLKTIRGEGFRRFVEIGVGDGHRAEAMIRASLEKHEPANVKYTGIDLFEARLGDGPKFSIKQIHRRLVATEVAVRLVPGDAAAALPRCANDLRGTDLVVVRSDQDPQSLERAWHFLPRMLHQASQVWIEPPETGEFEVLTPRDISARLTGRRQRAA